MKRIPRLLFAALLALCACSDDSASTTSNNAADATSSDVQNVDSDGDALQRDVGDAVDIDAPTDTDVADAIGSPDATDADPDANDATDVEPDATDPKGANCECPDPESECTVFREQIFCARDDVADCDDEACPEGYFCGPRDKCECDPDVHGEDACAPSCEVNNDCPGLFKCNVDGRCYTPQYCESQVQCDDGEWCMDVENVARRYCHPPGSKSAGESCDVDTECESGICTTYCRQRCQDDSDCDGEERCHASYGYCNPRLCTVTCEPDQICDGDECLPRLCYGTYDCDSADCFVSPGTAGVDEAGVCGVGFDSYCKPSEFRIWANDPYCRLPQRCSDDVFHNDCPDGYECVTNGATSGYERKWCSRRVKEGEWP